MMYVTLPVKQTTSSDLVHCAVTLHIVSLETGTLFENNAPPFMQLNSPDVLYPGGSVAGFTVSIRLITAGQSENTKKKTLKRSIF